MPSSDALMQALSSGQWGTVLGIAYAAGLATALTPCVYPMIVITVSVFGARDVKSRAHAALLSACFVAGMVVLFTGLGLAAALTGSLFGAALGSLWVAVPMAGMMVAFALSMFGAFEIGLPASWQTRLSEVGGGGYAGAFLLGTVSSLIAAPCVGPVLGLLLPWIGTRGDLALGGAAMLAYALGLGTLFFLVGTFAMSLPRSGRWMQSVKGFFGVLMLASALYILRPWLPLYGGLERSWLTLGVALGALAVGLLLGATQLSLSVGSGTRGLRHGLGVGLAAIGAITFVGYLEAAPASATEIHWRHDLEQARAEAKATGRPMVVDFGAKWCAACGELERITFASPDVIAEAERFVPVKVDLTTNEAPATDWLAGYRAQGLPLVVLHDADGREVSRVTQFVEATKMLGLMRKVN